LLSIIALALAADESAKVTSLPNITDTYPFASNWYSGYLPLSENDPLKDKNLHYVFVESHNDKANDPLIVWFNGGPGCSSMLALFQEHGPYVLEDEAKNFTRNPFPWTERASIIYLESPGGVGYSTALEKERIYNDYV
jgi:carboxypeptidase C (cathepsin A)